MHADVDCMASHLHDLPDELLVRCLSLTGQLSLGHQYDNPALPLQGKPPTHAETNAYKRRAWHAFFLHVDAAQCTLPHRCLSGVNESMHARGVSSDCAASMGVFLPPLNAHIHLAFCNAGNVPM